ncbi:hypothetical protein ACFX2I_003549 [Malus domestica]
MLTLETTKPTWRAGRVINELTTSFSECGACQLVGRARPRSKFVDVALGRATDFCVLRLRPRKEHVSASWALEHEDKVTILTNFNIKFGFQCAECNHCNTSLRREG